MTDEIENKTEQVVEQPSVKEDVKQESVKEPDVKKESDNNSDEDGVIDEKEMKELEDMITKAEEDKLKKVYEDLKKEINSKDEMIKELKESLDKITDTFNKKLEEAINNIPSQKKGLEPSNDVVVEQKQMTEEEMKQLLKKQFFDNLNNTGPI